MCQGIRAGIIDLEAVESGIASRLKLEKGLKIDEHLRGNAAQTARGIKIRKFAEQIANGAQAKKILK